jgi:hypothetical protein
MISIFSLGRIRLRVTAVLTAAIFPIVCAAIELPPLKIPRVSRAPKLSDFLNDTPREAEAVVIIFKQFDPHDGEPVSQPTAAYLSYDSKNLYVGWICRDDPAKIRARVAPRKQIDTDDRVTINIDTFQDHKHAYWFDVNPYGIQYDGRTTDGKRFAEDLLPLVPHDRQQARRVPLRLCAAGEEMSLRLGHGSTRLLQPELIVLGLHLTFNKGLQASLQQFHDLGYTVVIADRHRLVLAKEFALLRLYDMLGGVGCQPSNLRPALH